MSTQLLKWRCNSDISVSLSPLPAPEPRLRDFAWEEKERNRDSLEEPVRAQNKSQTLTLAVPPLKELGFDCINL